MSLRSVAIPASGIRAPSEYQPLSVVRIDECLSSLDFVLIVEKNENFSSRRSAMNSVNCLETIEDARELFLKMPERNIVSWKTLISTLVLNGQEEKALDVYNAMILEGMVPTHFTLAILFNVCERWFDVEKGRKCHILGMEGLKQMDKIAEALEMFKLMCRRGISIHSASSFVDIEKDPSSVALTLLKAIIKLKLVFSEMYDPLIRVAKLMVTRQQQLWGAAAQALGLLVEIKVMKKGFHKHFQ
ncbi:putative pentatricopeptide [Rosa chinensis]|uniref:Putative pentatricopeptide n=1 Tax=Rosa chinensis TaxID=74649 RepID=A0A2P6QT91_ROSCH|nr:putative pentatricopeptide [Rosa chinensis]